MKQNTFKKNFTFEENFYVAVMNFITEDVAKNGEKNFNSDYVRAISDLRKLCNDHFTGKEYMMSLMEREPGKKVWKQSIDADTQC